MFVQFLAACGIGGLLNDVGGWLAGKKYAVGDFIKGGAWGCAMGIVDELDPEMLFAQEGSLAARFASEEETAVVSDLSGDVTPPYRISPSERGSSELDSGLNPDHFLRNEELDGAAHFGNEARVQDFASTHGDSHGVGFRVDIPTAWLEANDIEVWEGMTLEQLAYVIPKELFGEFNQFPRSPWSP